MNNEVENYVGELKSLREQVQRYKDTLVKIENFGHSYGHGRGYTCANWAKDALENYSLT